MIQSNNFVKKSTAGPELTVITRSKDLCKYILTITEKSPKKFRFTLVSRLQNVSLDIIELIYNANEIYMKDASYELIQQRLQLQRSALTKVKLLAYLSLLASEQNCILTKQFHNISQLTSDCQNLLGAWINSSRKRLVH